MPEGVLSRLDVDSHPTPVALQIPFLVKGAPATGQELRLRARHDADNCCGYFPALAGTDGITSDLPACRTFADEIPQITHGGSVYSFSFLRLSLVQQSSRPEFHLDSDAATALTGDVETLGRRRVSRMVLNLSPTANRSVHYLDVDRGSIALVVRGGCVRISEDDTPRERVLTAVIPPRDGASVHGLVFLSNRVLHSGVDDATGHFIAAYGMETSEPEVAWVVDGASNALSTCSRTFRWPATLIWW
jgi:hypothetical protein